MQNQIFNSVAGKVSTGSPLITAPANSCEDALNVVFPQQGSACTRQGHSVYGPIDAEVDNVTRRPGLNPTVTDWGFISQYPWPDDRYGARYNSWRTRHQYKIFNVNQSTNITGVLSSKPVLPGLKVDRSSAYGTYNPAEGFTDAIISVDPTTGSGMLGWVGNNGVTEGFTNSNESGSIRTDLCKRLDTMVVGYLDDFDVGYGQLFTKDWMSGFFDSCVTVQDYRFVDLGQNRLVMADSNKWLRATQPADLLPTYDVTTIPPQDPTHPLNIGSFGVGALPARVWMESPRIKVGLGALCSRYEPDRSGWLQEGYAVDVFVVVKTVDETGNIVYGSPSIIQTCKNYTNGLASVLVSPVLLETVVPYCSVNSVVEVYRTKQYKHYGLNMEVAPTVFYLCSSVALNTLSNLNGDVQYGLQPVGWTITGGPVVSEDATHPLSSKIYNNTNTIAYSTTYTAGGKNLILSTTLGMSCQTNTNVLSSTITTVTLYNGSANTSAVYCRNPQQVYSVQLPSQTVGSAAEAVYVSYATNISVPDLARLPILKFSEPKLYSAISLSNVDSSLIDIWTQGVEGVDLDTFPLVGGTVTSHARVIGYNAVLPPTTVLNNTTIPNSSSVHRIDNTLVLGESSAYRSLLLDKRAYQIIDENAYTDCEFFPKNGPKEYFKSGAFGVLSPFSWSNQLTLHTPTIYGQTPIQQTIDTFNYVSGANPTLTLSLASMPTEDFTSIPTTGIVLLWWAVDGDLGDNWNLLDMLPYSGGAIASMGAVYQNITFSEILSQHSGSYSGTPLSIFVAATIVSGSGINTVPVWMSQYKKALGTCVTAFAGKGYQLPYIKGTEDPTGFVSRINTGELGEGSCTSTLYGDGAIPTVDGLYFRSVSYKADTYGQNMTEGLGLFANSLERNSPDSVVYSTANPLQIRLKKEYYGNTGAGIGLVNKTKEITLGLDQYSYGTSQVFDTTLIQAPNTFPDLTAISTHVPNGVVFSKPNRYDVCEPLGNLLKIGDDNKPITNIVDFNGALYVFKEEEGIYRLLVDESNTFASSVTLIDNTHWMVSNKSVQLVMDGLYFVSNRGISILTSSESIQDISDPIQQEVSSYIASVAANADLGTHPQERLAKIASYANEARRLYAANFPRCGEHKRGVTLVYSGNTGQWSKTDQRFEAAWTVQDKTYTVEPIYTEDNQGDDTMIREATLFKKDNGAYDLYAEADQHDGKFLTSTVIFDRYAGPGPQENPMYKYDPVSGQIDLQDSSFSTPTDGRGIMNFYKANKNKAFYVDLFGEVVKTTITPRPATTGLQVSGYVRDESMLTDGKQTDSIPFEKLDYVYFSGITCNYNGPEDIIAATGTTFSFEPKLMYDGTYTDPVYGVTSTNVRTLVTTRGRRDSQNVLLSKLLVSMNTAWAPTMGPYIYRIKNKNGRGGLPRIDNLRTDLYTLMVASGYDGIDIDVEGYWQGFVAFRASSIDASTLQPTDTGSQPVTLNPWIWEVGDTFYIQELTGADEYSEASWTTRHTTTIASVVDPDPSNGRFPYDTTIPTKIGLTAPYSIPIVGQYRVKHSIDIPARTEAFIAEMAAHKPVGAILATAVAMDSANPVTPFGPNHIRDTAKYFDVINLMAYDFQRDVTTHNAPLYDGNPPFDTSPNTGIYGINHYMPYYYSIEVAPGVLLDKRKLVLGFPAYSWQWGNVTDPRDGGYRKPGSVVWGSSPWPPPLLDRPQVDYGDLYNAYRNDSDYMIYTDATDKVKWMYNLGEVTIGTASYQGHWANFEDAEVMETKAAYARDQGIGGVFYWHLNGDLPVTHRDSLIAKAYDVIGYNPASTLRAQIVTQPYPAYPNYSLPNASAPITVGITSEMVFNAYFATEGRGKARFLEGSVLSRGSCTGVGLAFRTSITSTWPSVNAIGTTAEVFRAFIPREACVGRWVQMKMRHDTPLEFIKPYGISYVYREFEQQEKSTRNRER